jgi:hypothetical protein
MPQVLHRRHDAFQVVQGLDRGVDHAHQQLALVLHIPGEQGPDRRVDLK